MSEPTLSAVTESGDRWDDPSESLLLELMSAIEGGHGTFRPPTLS